MASLNESTVYYGFWENHDLNYPYGLTLTVPTRWGNYLIAALSALVAWAGISFYGIVAFVMHQKFASKKNRDVLDYQLQVLFRSPAGALESAVESMQLHFAWKNITSRVAIRIIPFAISAFAIWFGFIAGSVLVAEVASKSYGDVLVLSVPQFCGDTFFGYTNATVSQDIQDADSILYRRILSASERHRFSNIKFARTYAESFYGSGFRTKPAASISSRFKRQTLPFNAENTECPWGGPVRCLGPDWEEGPALKMDTGLLDSHKDLGINARPKDRVKWRTEATCGVVDMRDLEMQYYDNNGVQNRTVWAVNLYADPAVDPRIPEEMKYASLPASYWDAETIPVRIISALRAADSETLAVEKSKRPEYSRRFIPELEPVDWDVGFYSVSLAKLFREPVRDPLFLANQSVTRNDLRYVQGDVGFMPFRLFNIVGCTARYQLCNPLNGKCTKPVGMAPFVRYDFSQLELNKHQMATALRLATDTKSGAPSILAHAAQGESGLLATNEGGTSISGLPENQWQLEVQMWFAAGLVNLQTVVSDWSTKSWLDPGEGTVGQYVQLSALDRQYKEAQLDKEMESMCVSNFMRTSAAVQNFSVLATALVLTATSLIILLNLSLPFIVRFVRDSRRKWSETAEKREVARDADDKYHLLRMALESSSVFGWVPGRFGVPVTNQSVGVAKPGRDLEVGLARYPTFPMTNGSNGSFSLYDRSMSAPALGFQNKSGGGAEGSSHLKKALEARGSLAEAGWPMGRRESHSGGSTPTLRSGISPFGGRTPWNAIPHAGTLPTGVPAAAMPPRPFQVQAGRSATWSSNPVMTGGRTY